MTIKVIWAGKVWNATVQHGVAYIPTLDMTFVMTPDQAAAVMLGQQVAINPCPRCGVTGAGHAYYCDNGKAPAIAINVC
jgi:hypothetical protein